MTISTQCVRRVADSQRKRSRLQRLSFILPIKREPGWTFRIALRPVMSGENATHDILVDLDAEGQGELLSHSRATPVRITQFHFNDCVDEFFVRSFWARLTPTLGRKQHAVLSFRSTSWRCSRVEGFRTMADRIRRARRIKSAHRPAMMRSETRRFGDRRRERLRIKSCCSARRDSATTDRTPPGPASRARGCDEMDEKDEEIAHFLI